VVAFGVGGVGVDENAQGAVVQSQPRNERGENLVGKGDLLHGLGVRPDRFVAPVAEAHAEMLADAFAQLFALLPLGRPAIVDMGVMAIYENGLGSCGLGLASLR
jgi:hypothetical protein